MADHALLEVRPHLRAEADDLYAFFYVLIVRSDGDAPYFTITE